MVRVNNYKLSRAAGQRTDVHYSFYGDSIRKAARDLMRDGVSLCMCKCPNSHAIRSKWHIDNGRENGVDFRYIYRNREKFWFCDTYIPESSDFLDKYQLLDGHVPTTGFSAILDILSFDPKSVYLTGFDFFRSGLHNVNEKWFMRNPDDPIAHVPEREAEIVADIVSKYPVLTDSVLGKVISGGAVERVTVEAFKERAIAAGGPNVLKRSMLNLNGGGGVFERLLGYGNYRCALEIGTLRGVSAAYISQFVERVITIDLKRGQLERKILQPGETFDRIEFWSRMGIHNITLKLVNHEFEKARFIKDCDFDFAFIDGEHEFEAVARDFEMVKRCGAVLFHDHDERNPGPVVEFVKTLPQNQVEKMDVFAFWKGS